jgi:glucose-1-phosphate thymidylyltransferase
MASPESTEFVGLIPAAGQASRLGLLPCSKELYPVGYHSGNNATNGYPKAVAQYLLEKMQRAGVARAYIVLRTGKWDIPNYFGDGSRLNLPLAYLTISASAGVPFTLDHAYPFVRRSQVAFGFPDLLFDPEDAFAGVFARKAETCADVVLGLCRKSPTPANDLVDFDSNGMVRRIHTGTLHETLEYSWAIAAWGPEFTEFLHEYTNSCSQAAGGASELSVGHAIGASVQAGLKVQTTILSEHPYLDIGTPGGLAEAVRRGVEG